MSKSVLFYILVSASVILGTVRLSAQDIALKTNGLYWLTTTVNAGVEIAVSNKLTIDFQAAYNPWTFQNDKKMRFWLAQPELKYWLCEKFEGHFVGFHLHGGQYFGGFNDTRYDGYLAGAGVSYGYDWILSPHWNLEMALGIGYAHLWFDKSPRIYCEKCRNSERKNYFGPTKAAISLIYVF
ncbi:uncharacterized protein BN461_01897 [Bacteroides sp. CAG:1076]|nr:uncharacterized protein BN461_01897 [Bacteroides sp. CAG:1076]